MIKAINHYFLAEEGEYIHWTEYCWFYGIYAACLSIVAIIIFG